jgi:hypothetical protein
MDFFAKNLRFYFKKVKPEVSLMAMAAAMLAVTAALYGLSCFFVPDHAPDRQRHNTCDDQANDDCSQHICSSIRFVLISITTFYIIYAARVERNPTLARSR